MSALPIPKNLVLLSLLENSKRATIIDEESDKDYDSGDDDEQVIQGISMMTSTCGTFVVKAREGLVIDPAFPSLSSPFATYDKENHHNDPARKDEGGIKLQMPLVDERMLELSISRSSVDEVEAPLFCRHPIDMNEHRLKYGQTVQVVSIQNGIAKLARDRGFIQAKSNQLVKICDPKDRACQLEATLESLTQRRKDMLRKIDRLEKMEAKVETELNNALQTPYDKPFAMAPAFEIELATENTADFSGNTSPKSPKRHNIFPRPLSMNLSSSDDSVEMTSSLDYSPINPSELSSNAVISAISSGRVFPPFPPGNENSGLSIPSIGCTLLPSFFDNESSDDDERASVVRTRTLQHSPPTSPFPTTTSISGRSIDFRTGMSGHLALASSSSHVSRAAQTRGEIRMMGEHRGIGRIRPQPRSGPPSPIVTSAKTASPSEYYDMLFNHIYSEE